MLEAIRSASGNKCLLDATIDTLLYLYRHNQLLCDSGFYFALLTTQFARETGTSRTDDARIWCSGRARKDITKRVDDASTDSGVPYILEGDGVGRAVLYTVVKAGIQRRIRFLGRCGKASGRFMLTLTGELEKALEVGNVGLGLRKRVYLDEYIFRLESMQVSEKM